MQYTVIYSLGTNDLVWSLGFLRHSLYSVYDDTNIIIKNENLNETSVKNKQK